MKYLGQDNPLSFMKDQPRRVLDVLNALYNSETNFQISCFYDGGFRARLGDKMNGFKTDDNVDSFEDAVNALGDAALMHYPESRFAKAFGDKGEQDAKV